MTDIREEKEYEEGRKAFLVGEDFSDNPYYQENIKHLYWISGWRSAHQELAALQQRITKLEEALRATTAELAVQIALQLGADNIEIIREKHPLIVAARALLEEKE